LIGFVAFLVQKLWIKKQIFVFSIKSHKRCTWKIWANTKLASRLS